MVIKVNRVFLCLNTEECIKPRKIKQEIKSSENLFLVENKVNLQSIFNLFCMVKDYSLNSEKW